MSYPIILEDYDVQEKVLSAMERYGGAFARTLAQLTRVADPLNRNRLLSCFTDVYLRYYNDFVRSGP